MFCAVKVGLLKVSKKLLCEKKAYSFHAFIFLYALTVDIDLRNLKYFSIPTDSVYSRICG